MIKIGDLLDRNLSSLGEETVSFESLLQKRPSGASILAKLFRDRGAALLRHITLERSSRLTAFDEERFIRFYPFLPHLLDLSREIVAGIRRDPAAPSLSAGGNFTLGNLCFEMLASDRTRLCDRPLGTLVSLDNIYELLEGSLPPRKQHDVFIAGQRCEDKAFPGMAARVAKAICLLEFARTDLPRTAKNIAALLVDSVAESPPAAPVDAILERMKQARFVSESEQGWTLYEYAFDGLREAADALEGLKNAVGAVNPRLPGWHNDLIQLLKKWRLGALAWYTRPLRAFQASVSRSIEEIVGALDPLVDLPTDVALLQNRLAQAEMKNASLQEQIDGLREQLAAFMPLPARPVVDSPPARERTAYVVGLFGSGRQYVCGLLRQNLGQRAAYFRDAIRLHAGPTPMIYSGHATLKYVSRAQHLPAVTSRVLDSVHARFADLIFLYRHPLDSLLTNWVWWRIYVRERRCIAGISQVYRNTEDLCADLERNFAEFQTFARGDPAFFTPLGGPRFLSFQEFVEETALYVESTPSLALRLEDFTGDPLKEFSKILGVMESAVDPAQVSVEPPRSKPYGYRAVRDHVPQFASFIDTLGSATKRRIHRLGYEL